MWLPYVGPEAWRHNADFIVSLSGKHRAVLTPVGKQEFGSSPAAVRFLQRQKASRSAAASVYLSCQLFHWPNQALLNLSFPTSCCCVYIPFVQLLQHQTRGLADKLWWNTDSQTHPTCHMRSTQSHYCQLFHKTQAGKKPSCLHQLPASHSPVPPAMLQRPALSHGPSAHLPSLTAYSATASIPSAKEITPVCHSSCGGFHTSEYCGSNHHHASLFLRRGQLEGKVCVLLAEVSIIFTSSWKWRLLTGRTIQP